MRRVLLALVLASSFVSLNALAQEDIGAAHEAVCCGATCCLIDGTCLMDGNTNPANPCQVCDPSQSQAEWTAVEGCTQPDSGPPPMRDAGTTTPPPASGGCSATGAGSAAPAVLLGLALALCFVRRRR